MPRLVLASTSPARRALLDGLGVAYQAVAPDVSEELPAGTSPRDAVLALAERKARAVLARFPDALVLGADQLVVDPLSGEPLGKPADREAARAQLRRLRGRTHDIVTGVCLLSAERLRAQLDVARLTMAPVVDEELERLLDLEEWRGCAGGYRIEGRSQALFAEVSGDRTSVQGLPMLVVVRLLREAGHPLF